MSMENVNVRPEFHHELLIAGFGGQGVLTMGQTLAEAALLENRHVIWTPSYGPEMRGGPAFCSVIMSSEPIGSPVSAAVDTAIIMDRPSIAKYQRQVRPSGIILLNSSLADPALVTVPVRVYPIRANHLAEEVGKVAVANMIMLGALLEVTHLVQPASILHALEQILPERRRHLIPMNAQALQVGAAAAHQLLAA